MKQTFVLTAVVVLLAVAIPIGLLIEAQDDASGQQEVGGTQKTIGRQEVPEVEALDYRLTGPFTHKNLSIFLIHGNNRIEGQVFLTLQEALEQRKVVVYETKDVNELAIENLSRQDVYVQAGDIVKGGQQDRMLGVDLIVPPRSGKIPIAAFCVEHGRWSRRGDEQVASFSSSAEVVATKDLKLAAKRANSQVAVWENVTVAQDKLSKNVGTRVNSTVSESSLQLAIENPKVRESADTYIRELSNIVVGKANVIGYAFAINGKVNSADVYASNQLFAKLWPKLLKANAIEAIAELQKENFEPATQESVETFLREAEQGSAEEKEVTARVKLLTRDDGKNIFFETRDGAKKGAWIHRNYIRK
jgi:ARG and Rhodanese-Phosphatase-superfamily-associated Protein domain